MESVLSALHIEQNHDEKGIIWGGEIAPFQIALLALLSSEEISAASENIYNELTKNGYDVLFDDRKDVRPGFKFNDADLLGMPLQVIVGEKNYKQNKLEIKIRRTGERLVIEKDVLLSTIKDLLK